MVTTDQNERFKVMNSFFVHGPSCRGSSRIVIFDMHDRYLGDHYVGLPYNLPDTLIRDTLYFLKDDAGRGARKRAGIPFTHGLPDRIVIACADTDGSEVFLFAKEK